MFHGDGNQAIPIDTIIMEMANIILGILKSDIMVVMSWGIHNVVVIESGIRFAVQGFLHQGDVEVVYDEGWDLFCVSVLNADGSVKEKKDGIYADGLIDCIDRLVEYCPEYESRVKQTYGLA